jgi:SAM-dependent MidA family methyltransferase
VLFIQAFRKDEIVDPLSDPGNVDIISDVDFEELTTRGMQIPHGNSHEKNFFEN